jgi:ATP synthase protein I
MAEPQPEPEKGDEKTVAREIGEKAERKLKARAEGRRDVWFGVGMFGLVGWSVAIPTIIGIVLGLWIDARLQDRISWTLTLLFIGAALGCVNAWYWVKRESGHD